MNISLYGFFYITKKKRNCDTIKRLMSYPKCKSVEVISNPARPGSNHKEVNYIKL